MNLINLDIFKKIFFLPSVIYSPKLKAKNYSFLQFCKNCGLFEYNKRQFKQLAWEGTLNAKELYESGFFRLRRNKRASGPYHSLRRKWALRCHIFILTNLIYIGNHAYLGRLIFLTLTYQINLRTNLKII